MRYSRPLLERRVVTPIEELRQKYPWKSCPELPCEIPRIRRGNVHKGLAQVVDLIRDRPSPIIVEIGSELGGSARFFCETLDKPTVICLDLWEVRRYGGPSFFVEGTATREQLEAIDHITADPELGAWAVFAHQCREFRSQIIPIQGDRLVGLQEVHRHGVEPDLVYVDGPHGARDALKDLKTCFELFPDAILCGDDWRNMKVTKAVLKFTLKHWREIGFDCYDNQFVFFRRDRKGIPQRT